MPGSLLSRVRRSESARSDRSDVSARSGDSWKSSGKKVSFNRAVRVKKFPRRADALNDDSQEVGEKRFWFKVYKNSNRDDEGSLRRRLLKPDNLDFGSEKEEYANLPVRSLDPIAEVPHTKFRTTKSPEMRLTADVGVGTSGDTLHPSQQSETPTVRRNHVKKMVTKFNEEALLKFYDEDEPLLPPTSRLHNGRPPEPPVDYATDGKQGQRKNPLINGVKVIFGMANLKNKRNQSETKSTAVWRKNQANLRRNEGKSTTKSDDGPPYRTSILLADEYASSKNKKNVYNRNNNNDDETERELNLAETNKDLEPSHIWESGKQLVSDITRYESTVDRSDEGGQIYKTIEEGNKVWKHEIRTIYEDDAPSYLTERRRAKSQGDLRGIEGSLDSYRTSRKGMSTDDLSSRGRKGVTRDMAIQCNRSKERHITPSRATTLPSSHRVIRSTGDGYVSAFSDVPNLKINGTGPTPKKQEAIYSQIDKTKKLLDKKSASTLSLNSKSPKVKSSQKSFGFRLKKAFGATLPDEKVKDNTYHPAKDEDGNWYDVDSDVAAANEHSNGHRDISEFRLNLEDDGSGQEENRHNGSQKETPGSVVREVDHKKREIFYENTPQRSKNDVRAEAGGLWYRGAEEDYRREMAHSDVSYPSGSHVGSSSTLGRSNWLNGSREKSGTIKSYTLDRKHMRIKPPASVNGNSSNLNGSAIKILVNGKEVDDLDALTNQPPPRRRTGSSPVAARGGLAAAYKARQKSVLKRSNSLSGSRRSLPGLGLSSGASSTASASSDGETSRRRRTLVMYIPGVDHNAHRSDSEDRRSGISRTQSLHTLSRPSKYQKHVRKSAAHPRYSSSRNTSDTSTVADEEADTLTPLRSETSKNKGFSSLGRKADIRRRHSMPKDTKFGWLKWKIKPKNRES